ncbi:MAG: hypothetical protein DCC65_11005 [Planctomycetota bacterium]|nr:MAG: hypothetical protein DCC65_11005 [Planctomycetota bacterium]
MNTQFAKAIQTLVTCLSLASPPAVLGQVYEMDWATHDGGGVSFRAAGVYTLGGTIGQADAGVMTGGPYALQGGFWSMSSLCHCPGDMNGDGFRDALDVQKFVSCLTAGGGCSCADVDGLGGVSIDDCAVFIDSLLSGDPCP